MKQVHERLFVGDDTDCQTVDLTMVHACKTCHQRALGYTKSLPTDHPNYLATEATNALYLNLIDPPIPLFKPESFGVFRRFAAERYARGERLLIHCNQGGSRAPSLALLFMAKDLAVINNATFLDARKDFQAVYPAYDPGKGIETFLTEHWSEL